jgi:hypothetical protein
LCNSIFSFLIKLICVYCGLDKLDAVYHTTVKEIQSNVSQAKISIGSVVGLQDSDVKAVIKGESFEGGKKHFNEATVKPKSWLGFALFQSRYKVILNKLYCIFLTADFELMIFAVCSLKPIVALLILQYCFLIHLYKIIENECLLNFRKVRLQPV